MESQPLLPQAGAVDDARRRRRAAHWTILTIAVLAALSLVVLSSGAWREWNSDNPAQDGGQFSWKRCPGMPMNSKVVCGTLMVPLDHGNVTGKQLSVAVAMYPATKSPKIGTLVVNPGGPGGSGVAMIKGGGESLSTVAGGQYDFLSFDPRGIGESQSILCYESPAAHIQADAVMYAVGVPHNKKQMAHFAAMQEARARSCGQHDTEDLLRHVSTAATARDMDLIRAALGEDVLNYWGFSYGTFLGATYVNMFPDHVGRVILDGVVDPSEFSGRWETFIPGGLVHLDGVIEGFAADCDAAGSDRCALASPTNAKVNGTIGRIRSLIERLDVSPLAFSGGTVPHVVNGDFVRETLFRASYGPSSWPKVAQGLARLDSDGDASMLYGPKADKAELCPLADYAGEEGFSGVYCNDAEAVTELKWEDVDKCTRVSEYGGRTFCIMPVTCRYWPVRPVERYAGPWNKTLRNKVLVVGNTMDPVTPLESARRLVELMEGNGVLLTHTGYGHCSTSQPGRCTISAIQDYLIRGDLPEEGTVCENDTPTFPVASESFLLADPLMEGAHTVDQARRRRRAVHWTVAAIVTVAVLSLVFLSTGWREWAREHFPWLFPDPGSDKPGHDGGPFGWKPCPGVPSDSKVVCGTLIVPLDHNNTTGKLLSVAVAKHPATKSPRIGTLVVNPGGPGGSGVATIKDGGASLSTIVGGQYDVFSFDPRGIGESQSILCYDSAAAHIQAAAIQAAVGLPHSKKQMAHYAALQEARAKSCGQHDSGDLLRHVSTASTARDMDLIRSALGEEQLTYWGFSYGTFLGATYANMFPDRVGRLILDGVVDPSEFSARWDRFIPNGVVHLDGVIDGFASDCDAAGVDRCALASAAPVVNGTMARIQKLIKRLEASPLGFPGAAVPVVIDGDFVRYKLFRAAYAPTTWPSIARGLAQLDLNGDASALLGPRGDASLLCPIADYASEDGFPGVSCNDAIPLTDMSWEDVERCSKSSEYGGRFMCTLPITCRYWPVRPVERYAGPWNKTLKNKVLVIGNTMDPVTPIESARRLVELMEGNGVLLTHVAYGHCSTSLPGRCTIAAIQDYLVLGKLPEKGTVCESDTPTFPDPSESFLMAADPLMASARVLDEVLRMAKGPSKL
ncbi:hypothetical protein HK101_007389 [Irineochytrium annulatum]|nr:hypothetical protein HK101_007389 [Irineochytrium annulatum]